MASEGERREIERDWEKEREREQRRIKDLRGRDAKILDKLSLLYISGRTSIIKYVNNLSNSKRNASPPYLKVSLYLYTGRTLQSLPSNREREMIREAITSD